MRFLFIILTLSLGLTACNQQSILEGEPQVLVFNEVFNLEGKPIRVTVFDTPAKRKKGLMWVKALPKDHGALFVFDREQTVKFWMKNTQIALDLYFLDKNNKLIKTVRKAKPCEQECSIYSVENIKYVLELASQ